MGETADQRFAKPRLELVEARAVDQPRDHLAHVIGGLGIGRHNAQQFGGVIGRGLGRLADNPAGACAVQRGDLGAGQLQRMGVILGQVIGHAGKARVQIAAAQILGRDHLTSGRTHQRRAGEKDGALFAHDDGHVGHGGHIGAAGGCSCP